MKKVFHFISSKTGRTVKRTFKSEESMQDFMYKAGITGNYILIAEF